MTRYERCISCQTVYICLNRGRERATLSLGRSQSGKNNKPAKHRIEPLPDKQKAKTLAPVVLLLLLLLLVVLSSRFTVASQGTQSRL